MVGAAGLASRSSNQAAARRREPWGQGYAGGCDTALGGGFRPSAGLTIEEVASHLRHPHQRGQTGRAVVWKCLPRPRLHGDAERADAICAPGSTRLSRVNGASNRAGN